MVVQVEEIRSEGLTVTAPVSRELLAQALSDGHDTGFRAAGPTTLEARLRRVGTSVLLHGELTASLDVLCKRCIAEIRLDVPVSFDLSLIPKPTHKDDREDGKGDDDESGESVGSFDLESSDQETFDGKKIDLDPIVREQVLLALPMHAVCREDCKGLCGFCGQNLNDKQCGCEEKRVNPQFAALKDIKLN